MTTFFSMEEKRAKKKAGCKISRTYTRHSSPARIAVVSADLILDYLATANVASTNKNY